MPTVYLMQVDKHDRADVESYGKFEIKNKLVEGDLQLDLHEYIRMINNEEYIDVRYPPQHEDDVFLIDFSKYWINIL